MTSQTRSKTQANSPDLWDTLYPVVRTEARRMWARLPRGIGLEFDDLLQTGTVGLLEAISRYDAERGPQASSFVRYRIRGAMLDLVRSLDPLSRRERMAVRAVETARNKLLQQTGEAPLPEVAKVVGVSVEEVIENESRGHRVLVSMDAPTSSHSETLPLGSTLSGPVRLQPEALVEHLQRSSRANKALEVLDERERQVLHRTVLQEETLRSVGEDLGVSEARVCQLRSRAVKKLRKAIAA